MQISAAIIENNIFHYISANTTHNYKYRVAGLVFF